jgi:hypothetical protein
MIDDDNRITTRRYEIETQASIVDYQTVAGAFLTALQAVTDLGVVRADLVLEDIAAGFALTVDANLDVGATFVGNLDTDTPGQKAYMKLPGVKSAFKDGIGGVPITGAIATWLASFEADGAFRLSDGQVIENGGWIKGTLDK